MHQPDWRACLSLLAAHLEFSTSATAIAMANTRQSEKRSLLLRPSPLGVPYPHRNQQSAPALMFFLQTYAIGTRTGASAPASRIARGGSPRLQQTARRLEASRQEALRGSLQGQPPTPLSERSYQPLKELRCPRCSRSIRSATEQQSALPKRVGADCRGRRCSPSSTTPKNLTRRPPVCRSRFPRTGGP